MVDTLAVLAICAGIVPLSLVAIAILCYLVWDLWKATGQ